MVTYVLWNLWNGPFKCVNPPWASAHKQGGDHQQLHRNFRWDFTPVILHRLLLRDLLRAVNDIHTRFGLPSPYAKLVVKSSRNHFLWRKRFMYALYWHVHYPNSIELLEQYLKYNMFKASSTISLTQRVKTTIHPKRDCRYKQRRII